jgi:hypothetical protein
MYSKISPSCSNIRVLHAKYMDALTKVQSAVRAIEAAYDQLSAIESGQSWLSNQGIPYPPVPELLIIEGNLVFARQDLRHLIDFGYHSLKNLMEFFGELQSEPL